MRQRVATRVRDERLTAAFPNVPFCSKVSDMSKTQIFIEKARAKHGDRYDYSRVVYVRDKDKVIITCGKHGDFEQRPNDHLNSNGCYKCGHESRAANSVQKARDSFIEKARAVHGDKYGYERVVYTHNSDNVTITCKKHGDFEQKPNNHLKGKGCFKCGLEEVAVKLSQEAKDSFVEKARAIHGDKYDYSKTAYARASDKVIITCTKHGVFEQTPNSHLMGCGCPSCPKRFGQPTNLYLMHNGLGKVKVGFSIDTDRRISELNQSAPFKAELLEAWKLPDTPTALKIESKAHRKLAKYHAGLSGFDGATEWFNTTPERARGAILKALGGAEVLGHSEANSLQLVLI